MRDFITQPLRASSELTTSYVGGKTIGDWRGTSNNASRLTAQNAINLMFDLQKGSITDLYFKLEAALELFFDLAYDGQSANFTVGAVVTGLKNGATGVIVKDTDGGVTGILVVIMLTPGTDGKGFYDNEDIVDNNGTPGAAVVNGGLNFQTAEPSDFSFYRETFSNISADEDSLSVGEHRVKAAELAKLSTQDKLFFSLSTKYPFYRVSIKGAGTVNGSLLKLDACIGQV